MSSLCFAWRSLRLVTGKYNWNIINTFSLWHKFFTEIEMKEYDNTYVKCHHYVSYDDPYGLSLENITNISSKHISWLWHMWHMNIYSGYINNVLRHNMYFAQKGTWTQELFDTHENQQNTPIPGNTKINHAPCADFNSPPRLPFLLICVTSSVHVLALHASDGRNTAMSLIFPTVI